MAIDQHLPPACAFAISVLVERDMDPDAVPEEAVEAAQHHLVTCVRCLSSPPVISPPRKKKRPRRALESDASFEMYAPVPLEEAASLPPPSTALEMHAAPRLEFSPPVVSPRDAEPVAATSKAVAPATAPAAEAKTPEPAISTLPAIIEGPLNCAQCRQRLQEYAEAMDSGQNITMLYPQVQEHLVACESGCLVLLDIFRQEAKASRKYRRRKVRDPFSAIGWELTGFFRGGQVPMSPMALSYGTLILLLLISTFSVFFAVRWDDARYYRPPVQKVIIPTPDGIGLSDGLKIFDACNASSYQDKRAAAQALQAQNLAKASALLTSATNAVSNDTTGCNGAEAAIYSEDLQVRQSDHPYGSLVVAFDSGPGVANPQGGTDRHILYAAYTQELIGAYIAQQEYNTTAIQTPGAPLLYLILANTTGVPQGALQIAQNIATLATSPDTQQFGLLASGPLSLLGVLGFAPSSLVQLVLPTLCSAGLPLIAPTATGLFIINQLEQTSLYRHCAPGFAFVRFSPDDANQSWLAANYAYGQLHVRRAAIFYDPSNPSSVGSADGFSTNFLKKKGAQIVARETAVASGLLDASGRPQASPNDLLTGLKDALLAKPRPDLIFAPLLTNDVITLAQDIAQLPSAQQPILMIGGEFVHPAALQELVQWARQQQLTLPRIFVSLISAVRPPDNNDWPKQFYASFCTSFAAPGTHCSGAGILDQGGLLFADGVEIVARALTPATGKGTTTPVFTLPTRAALVQLVSKERFAGVSSPIRLRDIAGILVTSTQVSPVILGVQDDGSLQIVG